MHEAYTATEASECVICDSHIRPGDTIVYYAGHTAHAVCAAQYEVPC